MLDRPTKLTPVLTVLLSLALACTAAPNPEPPTEPATWTPPPRAAKEPAQGEGAAQASAKPVGAAQAAPVATAPVQSAQGAQQGLEVNASSEGRQAEATKAPADPTVIVTVAGQPIHIGELLTQWLHRSSQEVLDELDQLVFSRLVLLEASRLGVRVAPEQIEEAYLKGIATLEREIERGRPGVTLDEYVERALDLDPQTYRARLRENTLRTMLAERTFRTWLLTSKHALARMIVVRTEAEASEVTALLEAGAPFEEVARARSIDQPEAERRGEIVPVVEGDTLLSRLAMQAEVGGYAGPVAEQGAWIFVQVVSRPDPLEASWPALRELVEASIAERRTTDAEVAQWKATMLRRYPVDLGPFLRMAGEPQRRRKP